MENPPNTPPRPAAPSRAHRWEPATPPLQGHTESIPGAALAHAGRVFWVHDEGRPPSPAGQHWSTRPRATVSPGRQHRCRDTLRQPPENMFHVPSHLPGRRTPPPLGAICLEKLKSNPFDVPLPTPSQLPAKNAGDFSLSPAADKSQIVPVAPFEVADTSVWLRAPSLPGSSLGYAWNRPSP